jgi:hypothetical protein
LVLPPEARLSEMIGTVLEGARKNGVSTERGEYRQNREGAVLRVRMILPVKASYVQIRAWLGETLNALPAVALEELSLSRNAAADGTVEGKVRLGLYLESRP